ncbi:hypothetical protein EV144_101430 [Flavobacterium sp. 270]|uniref:hypothetical protein n=1 Tax=Flavobacterium sp. 270 TaxID=2512114 RepID=UPI001064C4CA|nr:hypothetical protein [Flavobacterium sp. 270]TDW51753.1 hypothetical protein EV144_101430 [Flavobacterium sp. 270]
MSIRRVHNITIMGNDYSYSYHNNLNNAMFSVNKNKINYRDSVGNYMTDAPCHIRINFQPFKLENMGDRIDSSDGTMIIMMSKEEIQEITQKTFYAEGQFHAIDFKTFKIIEKEQ